MWEGLEGVHIRRSVFGHLFSGDQLGLGKSTPQLVSVPFPRSVGSVSRPVTVIAQQGTLRHTSQQLEMSFLKGD